MKRNLIFVGMMSIGLAHAQEGRTHIQHDNPTKRVGINTDKPAATLDLRKTDVPAGQVEGFLLPHLNQTERDAMTREALVEGLQIYNTTKRCIDWWNGSEWQCTNGAQKDSHSNDVPIVNTAITMPEGIIFSDGKYWISSIYDTDYLPYIAPTEKASWNNIAPIEADGNPDKTIEVQGIIPADGLTVYIPVKVIKDGIIPAYMTKVTIPAKRIQDEKDRVLILSWDEQIVTRYDVQVIKARLTPDNQADIKVKQLDLKGGLGSDQMGLILAKFKIPRSSADGSDPTQYTGVYEVRVISGIPDKNFGVQTNGKYEHQYLYLPMIGANGKLWLNNNLGADYADVDSPYFNPNHQAGARDYKTGKLLTDPTAEQIRLDHRAVGALFYSSRIGSVYYWSGSRGIKKKEYIRHTNDVTGGCPKGWELGSFIPNIRLLNVEKEFLNKFFRLTAFSGQYSAEDIGWFLSTGYGPKWSGSLLGYHDYTDVSFHSSGYHKVLNKGWNQERLGGNETVRCIKQK